MSRLRNIRLLVRGGFYYLTEHADAEAAEDELDIYDVEWALLHGRIRRSWPREGTSEIVGAARDGRPVGVMCRLTSGGKVRVITVYEDRSARGRRR